MTLGLDALIQEYGARLKKAGVPKPEQDVLLIVEQILSNDTPLDENRKAALEGAIRLREQRMPLERIFGSAQMYGVSIQTDKDVYKPYPETEDVLHYAATLFAGKPDPLRILDLGTGTGCILIPLLHALPQATGLGIDINEKALALAKENARANGLANRCDFRAGDWDKGLAETFDLLITNPPRAPTADIPRLLPEMRKYDPYLSLDGGADGLDFLRKTAHAFDRLSRESAVCVCQVGPSQALLTAEIFRKEGFNDIEIKGNYFGAPCCLIIRKKPVQPLWKRLAGLWRRIK